MSVRSAGPNTISFGSFNAGPLGSGIEGQMNIARGFETFKIAILFSGASLFALLSSVFLHEVGHWLAVFLSTGQIAKIIFNPFSGGVTSYAAVAGASAFQLAFIGGGGILLGLPICLSITWATLVKFRHPSAAPFMMIGVASAACNGMVFIVGGILGNVSDVSKIVAFGVPNVLLMGLGVVILYIGLRLFACIMPFVGFLPNDSWQKRSVIVWLGLFPYGLGVLAYNYLFHRSSLGWYVCYVFVGMILVWTAVLLASFFSRRFPARAKSEIAPITWSHALFALGLGMGIIIWGVI